MIAHLVSTGDEVLLGDVVDTNSAFLSNALAMLGIRVRKTTTVGDDADVIARILVETARQADICIVTGGLGPTRDDLTASACAKAAQKKLVLNMTAQKSMAAYFQKRGFELTKENKKQALLPETASVLVNISGTAPGFFIRIDQCLFFFLPGVPGEMRTMFKNVVVPELKRRFCLNEPVRIERLTVFGLPESKVGRLLEGFEALFPGLRLGFRADFPVIEVKIVSVQEAGKDNKKAVCMDKAKTWVIRHLEGKVVSETGLSMAQEVGRLLTVQNKTVAVAESCTGGLISSQLTDVSGSSEYFLFSGVTYANDAKVNILGVEKESLLKYGAVHELTAGQMASGARKKAGADIAVSTTGIAGPGGGTKEKPVGMVCIGIATRTFSSARTYFFPQRDRLMNKQMFAATALNLLRRHLIEGAPAKAP